MSALGLSPLWTQPPLPSSVADVNRWAQTALRWRMLYGYWRPDADTELVDQLGAVKALAWKKADLSGNPFKSISQQVSILYDAPPTWTHTDGDLLGADMAAMLDAAGWAQLMQRAQRDCEGMREILIRADMGADGLVLRPVWPHYVEAFASPSCPDDPVRIRECRLRYIGGATIPVWTWDDVSIADPSAPSYTVTDANGKLIDGVAPEVWPDEWRDSTGAPVLPYVLYHAARTGMLWDAFEGVELVVGTLAVAMQWSMFSHALLRASWPQRWAVGVDMGAADAVGPGNAARTSIVADPATVLIMQRSADYEGQPMIGQWSPGADPDKLAQAVAQYEERLVTYAGLSPADFARTSGDPRSGYALAISADGQAKAARKRAPNYRRGDVALARLVACMSNRRTGSQLPENGWAVEYPAVPPLAEGEQEKKQALVGIVDIARQIVIDPTMTPAAKRVALVALGGLDEGTAEKLIAAQGTGPPPTGA